ncbi:MAG TPA: hypothetical protein VFB96_22915 [Pirellulaceae bacterium]|nr:hypothetical protein [Pirellulaceae bacterium]
MPLRIQCPEGHTLVVSHAHGGTSLRCPKCGAAVVVPPLAPQREITPSGIALPAVAGEQARSTAVAIAKEPKPPPVLTAVREVIPPPVWIPPPKSRAIPEAVPSSSPPQPLEEVEALPAERLDPTSNDGNSAVPASSAPGTMAPTTSPLPIAVLPPPDKTQIAESTAVNLHEAEQSLPPAELAASGASDAAGELPAETPAEPEAPPLSETDRPREVVYTASQLDPPPLVPATGVQLGAYVLSACFGAAALFAVAPGVWDVFQYAQAADGAFVARWALFVLALGVTQAAYAIYLVQLPDWTSGWVVTLFALACAALYAGMLGVTLIAGDDSRLIHSLQLSESVASGRAPIWCLCMTTIMAALAFFGGRSSLRWRLAEAAGE